LSFLCLIGSKFGVKLVVFQDVRIISVLYQLSIKLSIKTMKNLINNTQLSVYLSEQQKQFLFKREIMMTMTHYGAWGIIFSAIAAWGLLYWLKPVLVSSSTILQLLREKSIEFIDLAELAVTGATAITGLFILLLFIALMMISFAKKEKQYFEIIEKLRKKEN